jgi:formylglycine-generating enzyme required for sulfatase activity
LSAQFDAALRARLIDRLGRIDLTQEADRVLVARTRDFLRGTMPEYLFVPYATSVLAPGPLIEPLVAVFTVREEDQNGRLLEGATVELYYRESDGARIQTLASGQSDANGLAQLAVTLTPAQRAQGIFGATARLGAASKSYLLEKFPATRNYILYLPRTSAPKMPQDAPVVDGEPADPLDDLIDDLFGPPPSMEPKSQPAAKSTAPKPLPLDEFDDLFGPPPGIEPSPRPDRPPGATAPKSHTAQPTSPQSVPAQRTFKNSIGMELIRIPAGKYQRGSRDGEGLPAEKPRHWVQITRDFSVGKYPVTQGQYTKVMGHNPSWFSSTGSDSDDLFSSTGGGRDKVSGMETTDFPVESVSWFDAVEFCNKLSQSEKSPAYYELTAVQRDGTSITSATVKILGGNGYRLLTEAEWEYVARAGTDTVFPWGDTLSSTQANFDGNFPYGSAAKGPYLERTTKVGSYPANAWGLHDTAGNVYEWVWDMCRRTSTSSLPARQP